MIATKGNLRELAAFTATREPVLSLYLDTDLSRNLKDQVKLVLRDLLVRARHDGADEEDVQRVQRFVDLEYDWRGRGLALFSCQADGLWYPEPLPVLVNQSRAIVSDVPHLMPLLSLVGQYGPYTVALVDQEGSRLLRIDMSGVVREEQTQGEPVKRQKQGGFSATGWQRHTEQVINRNMRAAAEATARFLEPPDLPQRLILAGTEENTARFFDLLPAPLQQSVVGTMPIGMNAPAVEIIERSREILTEAERKRQRDLVEILITKHAGGGLAVAGLADTLRALQEGRVMNLLVAEDYTAPGIVCPSCDYLTADSTEHCLFCGTAQALQTPNVVERAVHKAILQDAQVDIITGNPALMQAGSIGALLRY